MYVCTRSLLLTEVHLSHFKTFLILCLNLELYPHPKPDSAPVWVLVLVCYLCGLHILVSKSGDGQYPLMTNAGGEMERLTA